MSASDTFPIASPVVVRYSDLVDRSKQLDDDIEKAFGYSGLGLIVISEVPNLKEMRDTLLPLSLKFASLPEDVKEKYVDADSHYSFGWSHGKETLKKGQFDVFKGSYYNNPQYDVPTEDKDEIAKAPEVLTPNIWPTEDLPELEPAFKKLGSFVVEVGKSIAAHVDKYAKAKLGEDYNANTFENVIATSRTTKARLLHYFPIPTEGERDIDSWCGWHNDHSALTGLVPAMYIDTETGEAVPNPDPNAGLHAKTRDGSIVRVKVPADCLAFQIGECTQVFTGAVVRATPHAVRAMKFPESKRICRDTLAVFMQPNFDYKLEKPRSSDEVHVGQYKEGMTFGEFGKATIAHYYGY